MDILINHLNLPPLTFVPMAQWFETWFDSPYYHTLYKDRDTSEAKAFITRLADYLKPQQNQTFLDLACGKGRHSIQLNNLGISVEGCDYSANSIEYAKQFENDTLQFYEHDMRNALPKSYHTILNLFTSFGYFDSVQEHEQTLTHIHNGIQQEGRFVFDYLNAYHVQQNLVPQETIEKDGIQFNIKRFITNNRITKSISFEHQNQFYQFQEQVMAFNEADILKMMKDCGFNIVDQFGDYQLQDFDLQRSKRLILVLQKQ